MKERRTIKIDGQYYSKFCKCGATKQEVKSKLCNECAQKKLSNRRIPTGDDCSELINFVNKVNRRGGLASIEDIFVDMITIYNKYCNPSKLDTMETGTQLSMMWQHLNVLSKRILEKKPVEMLNDDEVEEKRREWREYRRSYYEKNPDKIKEYNKMRNRKYYERIKKKKMGLEE